MLRSTADSKQRVRDWSGPCRIVWLASYPRSGNTWTRTLLANLLSTKDKPVSVDRIADFADLHAARRETFDDWTGAASTDCTGVEVDLLRPAFYRFRAVAFSDFTRLRGNEEREGFREREIGQQPFFRSGKANAWRTHLNAEQVREILRVHGETMAAFGYDPQALRNTVRNPVGNPVEGDGGISTNHPLKSRQIAP